MKATGPKARQPQLANWQKRRNDKTKTIHRNTKRIETKRKKRKNAHKLSFLNLFRLRRRRRRSSSSSRSRSSGFRSWRLSMAKWPSTKYPATWIARSCRLTMCVRKGFKKCRIPEAAVQSVELKNERTDRGRRLDGIRIGDWGCGCGLGWGWEWGDGETGSLQWIAGDIIAW